MTRIGLALGGGGVRGLAHIGILRTLERHAIRPAVICGTSSGAIIGLAYAAGMTVDEMDDVCRTLRWRRLIRPSVRKGRVFDTERFDEFLATIIDPRDFDDLDYVCAAVACDSATREPVLLTRGDPVRAARASSALRGIFSPIEIDGRRLVDGAAVEAPARLRRTPARCGLCHRRHRVRTRRDATYRPRLNPTATFVRASTASRHGTSRMRPNSYSSASARRRTRSP